MRILSINTFRRTFRLGEAGAAYPTSMFWGLVELGRMGHAVSEFAPAEAGPGVAAVRRFAGESAGYLAALVVALPRLNAADVIFTISPAVAAATGLLRRLGLFRRRVVLLSTGYDYLLPRGGGTGERLRAGWRAFTLGNIGRIVLLTPRERQGVLDHLRIPAEAVCWCRQGIDTDFYRPGAGARAPFVLVVGNDPFRDWAAVAELAARARVAFKIVTKPAHLMGLTFPANVEIAGDLPMTETRRMFGEAACVLLLTKPCTYFSGLTTILAALSSGAVVAYDKPEHGRHYGLIDGEQCLEIDRAHPAATAARLEALLADPAALARRSAGARALAETLGMPPFAAFLEAGMCKLVA